MRTRRKILAVMCLSGAIAGIGGARQDGDFRHQLDPRGLRAAGYGYTGIVVRRARAVQPVRRRARGVSARWLAERRLHAAGRRLPVRSRRRHAGADPLLRARRRAARPLSLRFTPARRRGAADARREQQPRRRRARLSASLYGTPLLYAALGELLAERSGVLNLGVEGMMLIGAVMGFWAVAAHSCRAAARRSPLRSVVAALAGAAMALIHAFLVDHAAREPDRLRPRADDLRRRGRAVVVPRQRPAPRGHAGALPVPGDLPASRCQDLPIVGPIIFGPVAPRLRVLGRASSLVALYLDEDATGPQRACRGRVAGRRRRDGRQRRRAIATRTRSSAVRSPASAARRSACRSRRSGSTASPRAPAGSRSRSSSSPSGGRRSASSAHTSSAHSQALPFALQGHGVTVAPELFQTLPYVATIVALVFVSSRAARLRFGAPAALGLPYAREER